MVTRRSRDVLLAAVLLTLTCVLDGPLRYVFALPFLIASLAVAAASLRSSARDTVRFPEWLWMLMAAAIALGAVTPGTGGPLWYDVIRRAFLLAGVFAVGLAAAGDPVWQRRAVTAAVIAATLLSFLTPAAIPHPLIDVVPWTDVAVRAFLAGVHPYTVQAPDVYLGGADFGFVVRVYPYMPATVLVFAPFVAMLGDFRYALAACLPLTLWLVRRAGHRAGVSSEVTDAATLLIALHPTALTVVRSGWGEPLLGVLSAMLAVALVEQRARLAAVAALLLPAFKQYALAPVLLWVAGFGRRAGVAAWVLAALIAALTVVPFLVWNAPATIDGMLFQMRSPVRPRLTSISIPGWLANSGSANLPIWVSAATQLVVSAVMAVGGVGATVSGLFVGSAVALLATFVLGWQGFVNYYVWIGTLLALAAVTERAESAA